MEEEEEEEENDYLWGGEEVGVVLAELGVEQHEVDLPEASLAHVARAELDPQIGQLRRHALDGERVVLLRVGHVEICDYPHPRINANAINNAKRASGARWHEPSASSSSGRRGKSSQSSGRMAASRAKATASSVNPAASASAASGGSSEEAILARSATACRPGSRARPARNRPAISVGSGARGIPLPPPATEAGGARKEARPWKRLARASVSSERSSRTPRGGEEGDAEADGRGSSPSSGSSGARRELAMERASHAIAGGGGGGGGIGLLSWGGLDKAQ